MDLGYRDTVCLYKQDSEIQTYHYSPFQTTDEPTSQIPLYI